MALILAARRFYATNAVKSVTIIGAGLMGSGIAQVAAATGHQVRSSEQKTAAGEG